MEINNRYFFFSIKKAEDCLFSRRNGYQGILLFGYSIFLSIKYIEQRKADKRFNAAVIEPLSKKIQEEIDRQVVEELSNLGLQYKRYVEHWANPIDPINYKLYSMETTMPCFHPENRLFTIKEFEYQRSSNKAFREMWELK